MKIHAILPVKSFAAAKSRLSDVLTNERRTALARELFEQAFSVLRQTLSIEQIIVATDCPEICSIAASRQADVIFDVAEETGENLHRAVRYAFDKEIDAVLVLMADLAQPTAADVERCCRHLENYDVVIAPDRHLAGTNLLAYRRNETYEPRFGKMDSFEQHLKQSRQVELNAAVVLTPGLMLDIDLPEDYNICLLNPKHI